MAEDKLKDLPEAFQADIRRAVEILRAAGCTEIFLFGSAAAGTAESRSDIDLAVRGCPSNQFFNLLGKLLWELNHPVDLIDLDAQDAFARFLEERGKLVRVG
ncbi:MAG: nucleotidyltransferase family protein [Chloroflexia bacterium]